MIHPRLRLGLLAVAIVCLSACDSQAPETSAAAEADAVAISAAPVNVWADVELLEPDGVETVEFTAAQLGSRSLFPAAEFNATKFSGWVLKGRMSYAYLGASNATCERPSTRLDSFSVEEWTNDPVTGSSTNISVARLFPYTPTQYGTYFFEARAWVNNNFGLLMSQERMSGCIRVIPAPTTASVTIVGTPIIPTNRPYTLTADVNGLPSGVSVASYAWTRGGVALGSTQGSVTLTSPSTAQTLGHTVTATLSNGSTISDWHQVQVTAGGFGGGGF